MLCHISRYITCTQNSDTNPTTGKAYHKIGKYLLHGAEHYLKS